MLCFAVLQNFTNPGILLSWGLNLSILFVFLITCFVSSFFVLRAYSFNSLTEKFFFRVVSGLALFCFVSLPFFLLNIYTLYTVLLIWSSIWILGFAFFKKEFYKEFILFFSALKEQRFLVLFTILTSFAALLPPFRYDEMAYHLSYVMIFAEHGGIVTEPTMRLPLFTFNWHVIQTAMYFLGNYQLTHFATWATTLLTTLGIYAFLKRFGVSNFFCSIAALAFYLSPLILRYSMVFHNDLPLMLFLLAAVYSTYLFALERTNSIMLLCALCCSMFVGAKVINLVYFPVLIAIVLFWVKPPKKILLCFIVIFLVLGSVWYVRNIIIDGDPMPPAINFALGKTDKFWSKADYDAVAADLNPPGSRSLKIYGTLPWLMVNSTIDGVLRDYPVFTYALLIPFIFLYALRNFRKPEFIFWGLTCFAIALWLGTSYMIRYAHYLPLVDIGAMYILYKLYNLLAQKSTFLRIASGLGVLLIMFGLSSRSFAYSFHCLNVMVPVSTAEVASFASYGSPEILNTAVELSNDGLQKGDRVYLLEFVQYKYYFMKYGYQVVGDNVNKWRYSDFLSSLERGKLNQFVEECKLRAIVISKGRIVESKLETQLSAYLANGNFKKVIEERDFWVVIL